MTPTEEYRSNEIEKWPMVCHSWFSGFCRFYISLLLLATGKPLEFQQPTSRCRWMLITFTARINKDYIVDF